MKTILFYDENVNIRGTSTAIYDYAHFNETILGNKSIIGIPGGFKCNPQDRDGCSLEKYESRFDVHNISDFNNIEIDHDYFYIMKNGIEDSRLSSRAKNLVHAVFNPFEPHGDVYAAISDWLAKRSNGMAVSVPYMVNLPDHSENLRQELGIDSDKLVFGWYGGNSFNIPYAREAVVQVARHRKDAIFLFMNQDVFASEDNIIFLPANANLNYKVSFINTCDIMLHGRLEGESFGLAVAEFSSKNKPVITNINCLDQEHIEILGEKGFYYDNEVDLTRILLDLTRKDIQGKDWDCYKEYRPEPIMNIFKNVFLS